MKKYFLIVVSIILFTFGCNNREKDHTHELIHHDGKTPTCTEVGYLECDSCSKCNYTTYKELPALGHDLIHHDGKTPTCTEPGFKEYDTCSRCDFSTFEELSALDHDLIHHDGKTPTCTDSGYNAYDTCTRCNYSTYEELLALDHDLIHHEGKDATYMEEGYLAYDTCTRCNYSTYQSLPKLLHKDYKDKTILSRDYNSYDLLYEDVLYAKTRSTNTMIVYNNYDYVKTNIYGKEALINEYGRVLAIDTNVDVSLGYMVLSAHGTRTSEITNLNIGDYVIYYGNVVYIFRGESLPFSQIINDIFCRYYDLENYLQTLEEGTEKEELIKVLNEAIPYLEKIYDGEKVHDSIINDIYENFYSFEIQSKKVLEYCTKQEELSDCHNKYDLFSNIEAEEDYSLVNTYTKTLYYGGFRNADTLVYYDSEYWRERNTFGYEIAIDSNGIVIDKKVLVDLPDGGFILSGHGLAANFLKKINLNDYVQIENGKVYFYRKIISDSFNDTINKANMLISEINYDFDNGIKHDYELIDNIINEINNLLPTNFNHDIYNIERNLRSHSDLLSLVKKLSSLTIVYDNSTVHGMWYYPLRDNYDNTVEGLSERLDTLKSIGINNIFITPLASDGAIFPNSMYIYSPKAESNNYEGYSNYLDCFISLAHSKGIKVTAFTQTFMHYNSLMKCNEDWTYQIDMDGSVIKTSVNYLDICNDNIKQMLYDYYTELMQYDFDGIEYDIIRYPESNLYYYLNVEKINKTYVKDPGWSTYSVNKFIDEYNIEKGSNVKELVLNSLDMRIKWLEYKENELIEFITNTTKILKDINPDIVISAAVLSNYDSARKAHLQDYKKWLDLGIVDVVEPMNYTSDHLAFMDTYDYYYNNNEYSNKTRMGMSNLLDGDDIIEDFMQLRYSMKYGYVIFSNNKYLYNFEYIKYMQLIYKGDR